jgi:hypothetical protein
MAGKLKLTEEFLWQLHEFLEGIEDVRSTFAPRSWGDVINPEWRKLRLAYEKKRRKRSFVQFLSYLKKRGYIKTPTGKSVGALQLTKKGKQKALEGRKRGSALAPRKDGKMIMLMYDIPKSKQYVRKAFRNELEFLDYQLLQKSVWVSDKDVMEETESIVREYNLSPNVNIFIIEKVRVQK